MQDDLIIAFKLHAQTRHYHRQLDDAHSFIQRACAKDVLWSVSFSGGKDSTVLLHLVHQYMPNVDVIWFDNGWDYPETLEFLRETEQWLGRQIIRVGLPVSSIFWRYEMPYRCDDPAVEHKADITASEWRQRYGGAFVGMRKEESGRRHQVLSRRGGLYYHKTDKHWICCPLLNWSYKDIWAYIFAQGLRYNRVYDKLAELNVPERRWRVGPITAWQAWPGGALVYLRRGWPELYNRFMEHFPEARRFS